MMHEVNVRAAGEFTFADSLHIGPGGGIYQEAIPGLSSGKSPSLSEMNCKSERLSE
jgi:hypothetical protein